jgi:hypothetical protein
MQALLLGKDCIPRKLEMLRKLGAGPAIFSSTFAEDNLYYVFMWLVFCGSTGFVVFLHSAYFLRFRLLFFTGSVGRGPLA